MESLQTLAEVQKTVWQMLFRGAVQKKDPLHTATIGTVKNGVAQMRTVVLRKTNTVERQLYFYTDIRSAKVLELADTSTLSWLFYHPKKNVQIRAVGQVVFHHQNDIALEKWRSIPSYGRKTYGTRRAPGTVVDESTDDLPSLWQTNSIDLSDTEYAYEHFAVGLCTIDYFEWLHLQRAGHRRAEFAYVESRWEGTWLVP
ncbi:MAG: pyridoxamine 5'-phosphate oxidase family protein [Bacteroidota bacterium]